MTTYRLTYPAAGKVDAPVLDASQQSVVDHEGGPMLVLAGPGTGKTTTLVEAVVDRIENRGASPESVLVLTFSRKAAEQLRDRITGRLGRTVSSPLASTFHSFAYSLVREFVPTDLYADPLRLLSAPQQDVILQGLLTDAEESVTWPDGLRQAVGTRGFAREVQMVLARAREKGLEPDDLARLGKDHDRPDWVVAGRFMEQYLTNLDAQSAIDYPELVHRAVLRAEDPEVRAVLRARYTHVFVDEYQDTDPSQVRLLQSLAGDGRNLTVVGDPDQSIYAFRGAEVRGILDFPDQFRTRHGARAEVVALRQTRRFGSRMLRASRAVAGAIPMRGAIDAETFAAFRSPAPVDAGFGHGRVEARTFDTDRAEVEHIADLLRRAHLEDDVPWSQMAVLVRSGRSSIPALRRSLGAAGVPVEVASDDTPLVREPAVKPLLDALSAVVNLDNDDVSSPGYVAADTAEGLLISPLAALDATDVRTLARQLRQRDKEDDAERDPRPSPDLLRQGVLSPEFTDGIGGRAARKAAALSRLLREARARLDAGGSAEEVLWELWSGTEWPARLRRSVELGGQAARLANRDLDAACALFEEAARIEEQRGHTSVGNFLAELSAQQIPADTLADRGVRGEAVRLLTAHRAKGLEWQLVVVAHVQEGSWPDLRRRASLLAADRLGRHEVLPPVTTQSLLADERRLFYVACTRARQRLVVTAVASDEDDGEQPSRFVEELDVPVTEVRGRPARPLSLAGLVAELRRTSCDDQVSEAMRAAATRRLAALALAADRGTPTAPQADPAQWWGTRARSRSATPVRPADAPVTLSASALEAILTCPAKWFLEREAGGSAPTSQSQGFGSIVHALADRVAKGGLGTETGGEAGSTAGQEGTVAALMEYVDRVWGRVVFRTPWSHSRERAEIEAALTRFVHWHHRPGARTVLATEQELKAQVTLPDGQQVTLYGFADRLELDELGRVIVVDLKTGKYPPTDKDLPTNAQLGLYQHAVNHGALDELLRERGVSGGAELIQLRKDVRGSVKVQQQEPQPVGEDGSNEVERQLARAAEAVRSEEFRAQPGKHCQYCSFEAICPVKGAGTVLS